MLNESILRDESENYFFFSERYEIWVFSIIGALCVGLSGVFPLLVIPIESGAALKHGEPAKKLRLMLSFAVGSLLADVFLHLLPEVWAKLDRSRHDSFTTSGLWVIFGLLGFMCIEKLLGEDSEEKDHGMDLSLTHIQTKNPNYKPGNQASQIKKNTRISAPTNSSQIPSSSSISKSKSPAASPPSSTSLIPSSSMSSNKTKKINVPANGTYGKSKTLVPRNKQKKYSNGKDDAVKSSKSTTVKSSQSPKIKITGYLNLFANVIDNFTHGLAVGCSFCVSPKVGFVTTFAILLHEIPHEVGDFAILLQSGFDKWKAAKAQVWTASGGMVGAITALTVDTVDVTGGLGGWILPFTSGGFLYIALVTVVPDLLQEKQSWESLKQTVFICLGILSIVFVTIAFD